MTVKLSQQSQQLPSELHFNMLTFWCTETLAHNMEVLLGEGVPMEDDNRDDEHESKPKCTRILSYLLRLWRVWGRSGCRGGRLRGRWGGRECKRILSGAGATICRARQPSGGDSETHLPGRLYRCLPQLKPRSLLDLGSHSFGALLTSTSTAPWAEDEITHNEAQPGPVLVIQPTVLAWEPRRSRGDELQVGPRLSG